jgi:hypothetical protein
VSDVENTKSWQERGPTWKLNRTSESAARNGRSIDLAAEAARSPQRIDQIVINKIKI